MHKVSSAKACKKIAAWIQRQSVEHYCITYRLELTLKK